METKTTQCHPKPAVNATCLLGEKGCYKNGKCHYIGNCEHKVLTNADSIRAMSDEELAEFLESTHSQMAIKLGGEYIVREKEYIGIWLQQPAEE